MSSPDGAGALAEDLDLLQDAARAAGAAAMAHFRRDPAVWEKADGAGPVSEADLAADALLKERLRAARPAYGWLSEETPDDAARLAHDRVFVVDPIDGTRAFVDGRPGWCVAVAVVKRGTPVAGCAWFPVEGVMYAARRGGGAVRDGAPLSAAGGAAGGAAEGAAPETARILAVKSQFDPRRWPGGAPPAANRAYRPSLIHRFCLVAEGAADATLTFRPAWEWDLAAGAVIAAEAGCVVTDADGAPLRFNRPKPQASGLLVAPPALHAALLARRRGAAAR